MAMTNFPVNDALAVKLWSKTLDHEALKYTDIFPLIGNDANSIIHHKTETSKGAGDKVTYGLRMQLTGSGFTENQLAEGNGESLTIFSDSIVINELGHVVGVKSQNTIDQQRVPFDLRMEARDGLADWYAKRFSVAFFNQVCGFTPQADVRFTGLQASLAATTGRIIRQSSRTDDASLVSTDVFTINLIDKAKEAAITAVPKIRPIRISGKGGGEGRRDYNATLTDKYVMYLHPYQVTDMRTNTSTGQWLDIVKAAYIGLEETGNPIFSGAIGEYNGVILRQSFDVTNGVSNAGVAQTSTNRAVLLGGQACMMAFGQKDAPAKYRWNEELFDHKRRLEVSAWTIHGLKKTQFNSLDYGTVVVSTWSAAHT
jgi:N4-gp56 family major capsid protein